MPFALTTHLGLTITIKYDILPPMEVEGSMLPLQVDILQVLLEIPDVNGKPRKVNILSALDEATVMLLEDEALEELSS